MQLQNLSSQLQYETQVFYYIKFKLKIANSRSSVYNKICNYNCLGFGKKNVTTCEYDPGTHVNAQDRYVH